MKYELVGNRIQGRSISNCYLSCKSSKENTEISLLSTIDYAEKSLIIIKEETFITAIDDDFIILYHFNKPGYYKVDIKKNRTEFIVSDLVLGYKWSSGIILYIDRNELSYKCYSISNELLFEFKTNPTVAHRWFYYGILKFVMNSKEKSWISCLDPNGGKEIWRVDFDWKISRLEIHKDLIVISYHSYERFRTDDGYEGQRHWYNPYKYTIVIDGSTGKEIWRFDEDYHYIDFDNEVVLLTKNHEVIDGKIQSMSVIELDIYTGKELTSVLLSPVKSFGVIPSFVDNEYIYYKVYKGPFGKISKKTGKIVWEFDLIDPNGDKRMVNDWILLGNGKLVLQPPPNQKNGYFTCIFDPDENMQFANIIDGVSLAK